MTSALLHKAWRESRVRFLLCAAVLMAGCLEFLVRTRIAFPPPEAPALQYTAFVWGNLIGNRQPIVFAVMALVLGLGGLQRERANGTAVFTLTLPVMRRELIASRALVGVIQTITLATVPLLVVALLAPIVGGQSYAFNQAWRFGLLFAAWGVVFFAVGLLWSSLLRGVFSALTACILTPFVYLIGLGSHLDGDRLPPDANFATFMSGMRYFDRTNPAGSVLAGVFPWMSLAVLLAAAGAVVAFANWRTARQDF